MRGRFEMVTTTNPRFGRRVGENDPFLLKAPDSKLKNEY